MVTRSPILRSSRASRVESAAAPNRPRHRASASRSATGIFGSSVNAPSIGIGAVHRLEFDQSEPAVAGARHGAQRRRYRYFAARTQKRDFVRLGLALDQGEGDVAAEQGAALARQSLAEAGRDRADAGDRHHAERDAGDENVKAAQAAAQFAQRIAQRQAMPRGCRGPVRRCSVMKRLCDPPAGHRSGPSAAAPRDRSVAPARCRGSPAPASCRARRVW